MIRQAGELPGGQAQGDVVGRAQEAQGAEQLGGELAPADDRIDNLLHLRCPQVPTVQYRAARTQVFQVLAEVTGAATAV